MANLGNIRKWVDALRSGEFQQGTQALNRNGKFCCLGVACEVAIRNGLALEVKPGDIDCDCDLHQNMEEIISYNGDATVLPEAVKEWLGLERSNPSVEYDGDYSENLATLNDSGLKDFAQLADIIEANYLTEKVPA